MMQKVAKPNDLFFIPALILGTALAASPLLLRATSPAKVYWTELDASTKKTSKMKADLFNETIVNLAKDLSPGVVTVLTTSEMRGPNNMMGSDDMFEFFFGGQGRRWGSPGPG